MALIKALVLVLIGAAVAKCAVPLQFIGYMGLGREVRVVVFDSTGNVTSGWLKPGQVWRGWSVVRVENGGQQLVVSRGSEYVTLGLVEAQTRSGSATEASAKLPPAPRLLKGTFSEANGRIIYSPDAMVEFGQFTIRALHGNMEGDSAEVTGNLHVETSTRILEAENSKVCIKNGEPTFVGPGKGVRVRLKP